jgi:MinD superfamily P-loop ATPase
MVSKAIAAVSNKGGVGKTTVLASVAFALARETRFRVAFVDVTPDAAGSAMLAPGCHVRFGTYAYLSGVDAVEMCTQEADGALADTLPPGPAPPGARLRGDRLASLLEMLRAEYNVMLVDLPGADEAHSDVVAAAVRAADVYLLVAEPASVNVAHGLRQRLPQDRPVVAVLNKFVDGAPGKHEIEAMGTSKYGKFAYVIPFEGPVHNAVVQRKLPVLVKGARLVEVVDRIAADLQRLILHV